MLVNLAQIDYLLQVINCSSTKKAAELLGVNRTTLLMSLSSLEKELNQHILVHQNNGTTLADNYAEIYDVLLDMKAELSKIEALRQLWQQKQEINIFIASSLLFPLIEQINNFYLSVHQNDDCTINIVSDPFGEVDFIFSLEQLPTEQFGYTHYQLFDSPYCIFMHNAHPLSQNKFVDLAQLPQAFSLFVFSDRNITDFDCQCINSLASLIRIILASDCLALIPEIFALQKVLLFGTSVMSLPLKNDQLRFPCFLLAKDTVQENPACQSYLSYLLNTFHL